jgi:hypothetical protein
MMVRGLEDTDDNKVQELGAVDDGIAGRTTVRARREIFSRVATHRHNC